MLAVDETQIGAMLDKIQVDIFCIVIWRDRGITCLDCNQRGLPGKQSLWRIRAQTCDITGGGNRTHMGLPREDFKSTG